MKRGILELTDIIAINKADGDNLQKAADARHAYSSALHLFAATAPPVLTCSALTKAGLPSLWKAIQTTANPARRSAQALAWMNETINESLISSFENQTSVQSLRRTLEAAVRQGDITPLQAARQLLQAKP